jgi:hypothetical protein
VGDGTVEGKDNKEEKTREVADICMYHIKYTSVEIFN